MSKKHFISLADAIRANRRVHGVNSSYTDNVVSLLADWCKEQNPRFSRHKWLGYIAGECGPNGEKVK